MPKFEFPAYRPTFEGTGTPNDTAFKGVSLEDDAGGTQVGLVHIDLDRAHVDLGVEKAFIANVKIIGNKADRIGVGGEPNVGGLIKDNVAPSGKGVIQAPAAMPRENNQGYAEGP
jgi:hypothetical protein